MLQELKEKAQELKAEGNALFKDNNPSGRCGGVHGRPAHMSPRLRQGEVHHVLQQGRLQATHGQCKSVQNFTVSLVAQLLKQSVTYLICLIC